MVKLRMEHQDTSSEVIYKLPRKCRGLALSRCTREQIRKGNSIVRFLMKVSLPVETGNAAAKKDGFKAIQRILEQQKPEAAYFIAESGKRTAILIVNMEDASQIAAISEPWFLAFDAAIEVTPAMIPQDLQKAGPAIEHAVKAYG